MKKTVFLKFTDKAILVKEMVETKHFGVKGWASTGKLGLLVVSKEQLAAAKKAKPAAGDSIPDVVVSDRKCVDKAGSVIDGIYWAY